MRDKFIVRVDGLAVGVRVDSDTRVVIGGKVGAYEEMVKLATSYGRIIDAHNDGGRVRLTVETTSRVKVQGERVSSFRRLIS